MRTSRGFAEIPRPLRTAVVGCLALAGAGVVYGVVESVRDYPVSSWFGVTMFLLLVGAIAGFVVGSVLGAAWTVASGLSQRGAGHQP